MERFYRINEIETPTGKSPILEIVAGHGAEAFIEFMCDAPSDVQMAILDTTFTREDVFNLKKLEILLSRLDKAVGANGKKLPRRQREWREMLRRALTMSYFKSALNLLTQTGLVPHSINAENDYEAEIGVSSYDVAKLITKNIYV